MESRDAGGMVLIKGGEYGDEGSGINQHPALHFDSPKPSKCLGFVLRSLGRDLAPRPTHPINPASSASSNAGRVSVDCLR